MLKAAITNCMSLLWLSLLRKLLLCQCSTMITDGLEPGPIVNYITPLLLSGEGRITVVGLRYPKLNWHMMHLQRPLTTLIDRLRRSSLSLMMHSILLWATTIMLRIYQTSINISHNLSIPLHSNASPVMYPLRSALAKNNARFATSSARPNRRKDIFFVMSDRICSGTACDIGVAIKPG